MFVLPERNGSYMNVRLTRNQHEMGNAWDERLFTADKTNNVDIDAPGEDDGQCVELIYKTHADGSSSFASISRPAQLSSA